MDRAHGDRYGRRQTQLALGRSLGLDKTTLTLRSTASKPTRFVTRGLDTRDRRPRIPLLTTAGREVQREVAAARDQAEASLLTAFSKQEQRLLRDPPARLAAGQPSRYPDTGGSCI